MCNGAVKQVLAGVARAHGRFHRTFLKLPYHFPLPSLIWPLCPTTFRFCRTSSLGQANNFLNLAIKMF